ncbi:sigma-54-dependent transcriptional regulator [Flavilitoribacter nigricans]|uniref:Sigma-54-dependent Fis family transcriptional regulator n=1 Tax=Flavilitoribacter nigricans (strain ATCC 23147 / DSM 23189 / NBRC 102662 / NCIMB 1420 / SS-2) TaxID=1122177 RepID=A0A2D0N4Y9_FLAN2|nr:sigma-54 dependent transcriptional regulator [Flavilitoribacter nigricans]PHN03450.1 hypothetical protein CRP01_27605 [Flavilitoribacter nigricans DSM 23189 = NBRC 102662]
MVKGKHTILVVDDDWTFLRGVEQGLKEVFALKLIPSIDAAKKIFVDSKFDLVLLDLVFNQRSNIQDSLDFLALVQREQPGLPVIVMSQYDNDHNFVQAIQQGAVHYFRKEKMNYELWIKEIKTWIRHSETSGPKELDKDPETGAQTTAEGIKKRDTASQEYHFLGETPRIIEIKEELVALSQEPDITVLLLGETGVGKEVAAHYLHKQGARRHMPFVAVNLSVVTETLMESTLFGHKKGAFTHALADSVGAFGEADGGTLFLDEIGEIRPDLQVKLLRFLQDKIIRPVGGTERAIDVQIVAATNKDLKKEIAKKNFRSDLFQRINDFPIVIPPLRERREDIPLLVEHYLGLKRQSSKILTETVWDCFISYHWPGNIRELVKLIKRLLVKKRLAKADKIDESFLPVEMLKPVVGTNRTGSSSGTEAFSIEEIDGLEAQMAYEELARIEEALRRLDKKGLVVKELQFKNHDQLRNRIFSLHKNHETLFIYFPTICRKFKLDQTS